MKYFVIIFCFLFFSRVSCLILIKQKQDQPQERKLNAITNPLGKLLEHTDKFVEHLENLNTTFKGLQENIVSNKKDIYKNMDTILSNFLAENNPANANQILE